MMYSTFVAAAALVAGAAAAGNDTAPTTYTEVVTRYTTYCPVRLVISGTRLSGHCLDMSRNRQRPLDISAADRH